MLAPALGLMAGGTSLAAERSSQYSPYWFVSATPNVHDAFTALTSVSADAPNDAWSVGYSISLLHRRSLGVIQRWNGQSWRIVSPGVRPQGAKGLTLQAIAAVAPDDVRAVGSIQFAASNGPLIEHWDGPPGPWWRTPVRAEAVSCR